MTLLSSKRYDKKEFWIFFTILTLLSLFMILWCGPLSAYPGHDYYFHCHRFEVLIDAIHNGNFPVHIDYQTLYGYGYFSQAFYPELVLAPFALVGTFTGASFAYNLMIFTYTLLCGLFMYFAVNGVFKNSFAASISAIIYTFSTYHFYDWYNRAALGEAISFAFIPLIFLGLYHIIIGDYKKWYIFTIGYSLLIYTHLLSSLMTFLVIVVLLLLTSKLLIKEPKRILFLLLAAGIILLIVASYLFPLIEQMLSNSFYYSNRENYTGYAKQTLSQMLWGVLSGLVYEGDTWHMRNVSGTGILPLVLVSLRLFVKEKTSLIRIADLCLFMGVILLVVISSLFPWGKLPLGFIQFPWRFYEFVVFFLSIAGAYYLSVLLTKEKFRIISGMLIIIFTIITMVIGNNSYKFITILSREDSPVWFTKNPTVDNHFHLGMFEYLPEKVPSLSFIEERKDSVKVLNSDTEINDFAKNNGLISFNIKTEEQEKIELPFIYYKGYKAVNKDKEEFPVSESNHGLVQVEIAKSTDIKVYYAGTIIQKLSWYITLLSVLGLAVYIIYFRRENRVSV